MPSLDSRLELNHLQALAATAYSFHEKPISGGGVTLQRVMLLGPTLFPLAFAALGGRSLRNIALWKAEHGSTIGVRDISPLYETSSLTRSRFLKTYMEAKASLAPLVLLYPSDH